MVADDEDGLRLWQPIGAPLVLYRDGAGRSLKDAPIDELTGASLVHTRFQYVSVLMWHPPAADYSVWWMFDGDRFDGWYVNLGAPYRRRATGIDTTDHALDLVVDAHRNVSWKDEAEFVARTGHPWYWDATQAAQIRATAERLEQAARAGRHPFDGTYCTFRPDPGWGVPQLPDGWNDDDRPAVPR